MAITNTPVIQGQNLFVTDVVSSADADTNGIITHGLSSTPIFWIICPTIGAAAAFAALPQWAVTAVSATTVTVTKVNTAGTAANGNFRLIVGTPHSIIR